MPIRWSGPALRSARPMPRRPSPVSATTITAPARQHGVERGRQVDAGGTSSATRSPGRTPAAASPAARSRTRWSSSAKRHAPVAAAAARRRPRRGSPARAVSADHSGRAPPAGSGGPGRWSARWRSPTQRHTSSAVLRRVLGDQVRGALVAVHVGVRQPVDAGRAGSASEKTGSRGPQSSSAGTSASAASPSAIRVQRGAARVVGLERDVGDEVADRLPPLGPSRTGAAKRVPDRRGQRRAGTARWWPRTKVGVRTQTVCAAAPGRAGQPDQRPGAAAPAGWCTAVLVSTTPRSWSRWASGPAERDRAAPVVGDGHDRPGRCRARRSAVPRSSTRCGQGPRRPVRSDQPMPSWSTATTRQPGGACGEEAAATGRTRWGCRGRTACVPARGSAAPLSQDVPGARYAVGVGPTSTSRDQAGSSPGSPDEVRPPGARRSGRPRSPDDLGARGVQARADAQQQHPVAGAQRVGLAGQGERHRGRAHVAVRSGRSAGSSLGSMSRRLAHARGCAPARSGG